MRKIIIALLILSIFIIAGCESAEEKAERMAEAQKRAEEARAAAEAKQAELERKNAEFDKELDSIVSSCSSQEDELNRTFCFAEAAVHHKKDVTGAASRICFQSKDNTDLCFFYVAVVSKDSELCLRLPSEYRVGCRLAANPNFCSTVDNKIDCMEGRAELLYFLDREKSDIICRMLKNGGRDFEEGSVCIDDGSDDYDEDEYDLRTKVMMTYIIVRLGGYEVNTVRY